MVLGAISYEGKREQCNSLEESLDSDCSRNVLIKNVPYMDELQEGVWYLQHDNTRPHIAKNVEKYINKKEIKVL